MSRDAETQRSTRPEHDRTTADRSAYSVDPDLFMAGIEAWRQQFADLMGGANSGMGTLGMGMPGLEMWRDAMQATMGGLNDEGATLMSAQKILSNFYPDSLMGLNDSDGMEMLVKTWSSQAKAWGDFVNGFYGLNRSDPNKDFADITGVNPAGRSTDSGINAVVLSNGGLDVALHWNDGVPDVDLLIMGPFPLGPKSKTAPTGLKVSIRRSADGSAQVVEVVAPKKLAAGRYTGIIHSADGTDYGHISLATTAD